MLDWKNETHGSKALMIEGARRVGKSTIAQEFGRREYKSFVAIDFAKAAPSIKECFNIYLDDLDTFFMMLSALLKVQLYERQTLFIFDEVQFFPRAREAVKFLVADGRYDYIETGSLISIKENVKGILIPSEERRAKMHPMDFEEFCMALGEDMIVPHIRACFEKKEPLEKPLHSKAMLLFKQYLLVGGMPQSVLAFVCGKKDFYKADKEKRDILGLYRSDIMKINARYKSKVLAIYDQIPSLLSRHEKRVFFNRIAEGSFAEQYEETFFWLSDSMITNECFLCDDPNTGFSMNENSSFMKCYLIDTGLLVSHAFDENELVEKDVYAQILSGKLSINEGMLYENMVAQMLVSKGNRLFFYTHYNNEKHRNDIEIDFLISNKSKTDFKISPVEVKSGTNYTLKSLQKFKEKFSKRMGQCYVVHPRNLSWKGDILCIPPYMAMMI